MEGPGDWPTVALLAEVVAVHIAPGRGVSDERDESGAELSVAAQGGDRRALLVGVALGDAD